MNRFIYYLTMLRSKRVIIQEYGKEFWCGFKDTSDKLFKLVLKDTPDIGKSIFSFNYAYAPSDAKNRVKQQTISEPAKQKKRSERTDR